MPGPTLCRPRPKNAAATRQAMLVAARRRVLQESYDNVGLRDIARHDATNDPQFDSITRDAETREPPTTRLLANHVSALGDSTR